MSDMTYRLVVDLSTRGSMAAQLQTMGSMAGRVDNSLVGLKSTASSLGSAFESVGDKIAGIAASAAKLGAVGVVGAVGYGVAHLNDQLEQTKISLAAIFSANGVASDMPGGLTLAKSVLADMRKDAAALPGEFSDLVGIFRSASVPGFQAGASVERLEKISANAMAAAAVTGIHMDQAGRELAQLMEGRAGAHNVLGLRLAGLAGDKAEHFNKLSGGERLKVLETELAKYSDSIAVFGESFNAQKSALFDAAKNYLAKGTSGIFEQSKKAMNDVNKWIEMNGTRLDHMASLVGHKLEDGFDFGRRKIAEWTPAIITFAANANREIHSIIARVEPLIDRLEPKMKKALADPDLFKRLEHGAMLYSGLKVGGAVAPMIGSLGGGGAMLGAAGPAIVVLAGAAAALHVLTDETALFHAAASESFARIRASAGGAFEHLGNTVERVGPLALRVADIFGTTVIVSLEAGVRTLEIYAKGIDLVTAAVGKGLGDLADKIKIFSGDTIDLRAAFAKDGEHLKRVEAGLYGTEFVGRRSVRENEDRQKTKTGAGGGGGGTHIQKVEIVVSSNQDPSRIARLTVEKLQDINRFPTSSPKARNWGASHG